MEKKVIKQTLTEEKLIKKLNQDKKLEEGDTMKQEVDKLKKIIKRTSPWSILGIKFVTYETAEDVLTSISQDLGIYAYDVRFIVSDSKIELSLYNNATACVYYFFDKEVFDKVVKELPKFNKSIVKD